MFSYIRGGHGGCQLRGASICPHTSIHPICSYTPLYACTPPYIHTSPINMYAPYPLDICMFWFPYVIGTWEHPYTPYVLESWGASVHLSGISVSVSISICPLSSKQSCQLLPIIVGCFLTGLDVYGCLLCFVLLLLSLWFSLCLKLLLTLLCTAVLYVYGS